MSDASYLRAAQEAFPDPQRAHATLAPLYVPPEEHETMRKAWEAFPVFMPPRLAKTEAPELPPPLEPVPQYKAIPEPKPVPQYKAIPKPKPEVKAEVKPGMDMVSEEEPEVKPGMDMDSGDESEVKTKMEVDSGDESEVKPKMEVDAEVQPANISRKYRLELFSIVYAYRDHSPTIIDMKLREGSGVEGELAIKRVQDWVEGKVKKAPKRPDFVQRLLALALKDFALAQEMNVEITDQPGISHVTLITTPERVAEMEQRATYAKVKAVLHEFAKKGRVEYDFLAKLLQARFEADPIMRELNRVRVQKLLSAIDHHLHHKLRIPADTTGRVDLALKLLLVNHVLYTSHTAPSAKGYVRQILRAFRRRERNFRREQQRRQYQQNQQQWRPRGRRTKREFVESPFVAPAREARVSVKQISALAWKDALHAERDLLIALYDDFSSSKDQNRDTLRTKLHSFSTWSLISLRDPKAVSKSVAPSTLLTSRMRNEWKAFVHPDKAAQFNQKPFNEGVNIAFFRSFLDVVFQVVGHRLSGEEQVKWTPQVELDHMLAHG